MTAADDVTHTVTKYIYQFICATRTHIDTLSHAYAQILQHVTDAQVSALEMIASS